jgi:hypothetical protein
MTGRVVARGLLVVPFCLLAVACRPQVFHELEYVSGNGQTYPGGTMPSPIVFKIKYGYCPGSSYYFQGPLSQSGYWLRAEALQGYQDQAFNNQNDYVGQGVEAYGGSWYVETNTGAPYAVEITVSLYLGSVILDSYSIVENISTDPGDPVNHPPTATLVVSPRVGLAPLESTLSLNGDDPDSSDIVEYRLRIDLSNNGSVDETITQPVPIEVTRLFSEDASVVGEVTDSEGATDSSDAVVIDVTDYMDVSGRLEDNETDAPRMGMVRAYDPADGSLLAEYPTTTGGDFSFTLNKDLSELPDGILLRARMTDSTWDSGWSYIRTVEIASSDHAGLIVRAIPYEVSWTSSDVSAFNEHMGRANFWSDEERLAAGMEGFVNGNYRHGLKRWNRGEIEDTVAHPILKGVRIWTDFSQVERDSIRAAILNSGFVGIEGLEILDTDSADGASGWGVVVRSPPGSGPGTALWDSLGGDGYVESFHVYLNTTAPQIVLHEVIWHGLMVCPGHSNGGTVAELFPSMGRYQSPYPSTTLTSIDTKAARIIDEPTYLGMESIDFILGE